MPSYNRNENRSDRIIRNLLNDEAFKNIKKIKKPYLKLYFF